MTPNCDHGAQSVKVQQSKNADILHSRVQLRHKNVKIVLLNVKIMTYKECRNHENRVSNWGSSTKCKD